MKSVFNSYLLKGGFAAFCLSAGLMMACDGGSSKADIPTHPSENDDITIVNGKVKFYLVLADNSPRSAMESSQPDFRNCSLRVNGEEYIPALDTDGKWSCEVKASAAGTYDAVLHTASSGAWHGSSAYSDLKVPFSQFLAGSPAQLPDYPMYASYSKETGNRLSLKDGFSILDITLKGSGKISSIRVSDPSGSSLSGLADYLPSKGQFKMKSGLPECILNCTDSDNAATLNDNGAHFYIIVPPGTYNAGLDIRICDDVHKMMEYNTGAFSLAGGTVKSINLDYSPASGLIWYEGFDKFVWGGDIIGGEGTLGYAPDDDNPGTDGATSRTGYENAFTQVGYDRPGSGFIQSNTWSEVSGKTVGTSHQMSESYVKSRGIGDFTYMFRCQEYKGCLAIGAGNSGRGIFNTGAMGIGPEPCAVRISFDFCLQDGNTDGLLMQIMNGGQIAALNIDGQDVTSDKDNFSFVGVTHDYFLSKSRTTVPGSAAEAKTWHKVEALVENATDGTCLHITGKSVDAGVHGIYIDNIKVTLDREYQKENGTIRVLYWNIQNGMWADQANNYTNFTKWVKKYNPDICVWCESSSIYKDNTKTSAPSSERFLPEGWSTLAAKYGHSYVSVGGFRDNYPQTITSRFPITTIMKITDTDQDGKPVAHGAGLFKVNVNGRDINIVTLHLWPQSYRYRAPTSEREASSAANEGDYYREFEMDYILRQTVGNSAYAGQADWLMMGDFNSRSIKDEWFCNYGESSTKYLALNKIYGGTDLVDIIAEKYPGWMCSSTMGNARIDYMFASPSMYSRIVRGFILADEWTTALPSTYVPEFYDPSDHRPILVDFKVN